jgi:hypothetical protein
MDGRPDVHHLQLGCGGARMLDGAGATDRAIAHEADWLPVPLIIRLIERVLEGGGHRSVVFRCHNDVAVELPDFLLPGDGFRILARHPEVVCLFEEEGRSNFLRSTSSTSSCSRFCASSNIHCAGFGPKRESRVEPMMTAIFSLDM